MTMDASAYRHIGDSMTLIFKLAIYALPASLVLNVILGGLLIWKW